MNLFKNLIVVGVSYIGLLFISINDKLVLKGLCFWTNKTLQETQFGKVKSEPRSKCWDSSHNHSCVKVSIFVPLFACLNWIFHLEVQANKLVFQKSKKIITKRGGHIWQMFYIVVGEEHSIQSFSMIQFIGVFKSSKTNRREERLSNQKWTKMLTNKFYSPINGYLYRYR